ncbi:MAG TPA: hypothetical protein VKY40_07240 [Halanaerobiales bacterium]|nr:hypothetical protein [Halanaerobiales bacterium]
MSQNLFTLLFQYIPEEIAVVFMILVFLKNEINYKLILGLAVLMGFLTYLIRLLPIAFGFHSILSLIVLSLLISIIVKVNKFHIFIAVLKTAIILLLIEIVTINFFLHITGYTIEQVNHNMYIRTLAVLPQTIILFLIACGVRYYYNTRSLE